MTLNLTFLGVLKRLKTDLSSQAQIQLWFITYIWISYIWSHNDEHYLSSSETVPEKKFLPVYLNPLPLQYKCSALPTKLQGCNKPTGS